MRKYLAYCLILLFGCDSDSKDEYSPCGAFGQNTTGGDPGKGIIVIVDSIPSNLPLYFNMHVENGNNDKIWQAAKSSFTIDPDHPGTLTYRAYMQFLSAGDVMEIGLYLCDHPASVSAEYNLILSPGSPGVLTEVKMRVGEVYSYTVL